MVKIIPIPIKPKKLKVTLAGNIIQQYYGLNEDLRNNQTNEPIQCQVSLTELFSHRDKSLIFLCKFTLYSKVVFPLKLDFIQGHLLNKEDKQVGIIHLDEFIVKKNTVTFLGSHTITNTIGLFSYNHDVTIFSLKLKTSNIPEGDIKLFYDSIENISILKGKKRLNIS